MQGHHHHHHCLHEHMCGHCGWCYDCKTNTGITTRRYPYYPGIPYSRPLPYTPYWGGGISTYTYSGDTYDHSISGQTSFDSNIVESKHNEIECSHA